MGSGPGQVLLDMGQRTCPDSKGKSDCAKKERKVLPVKKEKRNARKKDACKSGGCNKSGSCSQESILLACKKGGKSCPLEKQELLKKEEKEVS